MWSICSCSRCFEHMSQVRSNPKLFIMFESTLLKAVFLRFSLETMTVVHIASMQFRRASYAATVWNEKVYVAGGNSSDFNGRLRSVECYDLVSEEWTRIADMIYPRDFFAIVGWNGMLYAMGCHATVERYNPMRNEWTEVNIFSIDSSNSKIQFPNSFKTDWNVRWKWQCHSSRGMAKRSVRCHGY